MDSNPSAAPSLADEIAANSWYHTIELPDGVVTHGVFDTVRELEHVPLPASLEGKRCLDVGTADGFWAFEMERRGASEVVAVDVPDRSALDWPATVDEAEWNIVESARGAPWLPARQARARLERPTGGAQSLRPDRRRSGRVRLRVHGQPAAAPARPDRSAPGRAARGPRRVAVRGHDLAAAHGPAPTAADRTARGSRLAAVVAREPRRVPAHVLGGAAGRSRTRARRSSSSAARTTATRRAPSGRSTVASRTRPPSGWASSTAGCSPSPRNEGLPRGARRRRQVRSSALRSHAGSCAGRGGR